MVTSVILMNKTYNGVKSGNATIKFLKFVIKTDCSLFTELRFRVAARAHYSQGGLKVLLYELVIRESTIWGTIAVAFPMRIKAKSYHIRAAHRPFFEGGGPASAPFF